MGAAPLAAAAAAAGLGGGAPAVAAGGADAAPGAAAPPAAAATKAHEMIADSRWGRGAGDVMGYAAVILLGKICEQCRDARRDLA